LFVPFGSYTPGEIVRSRRSTLSKEVTLLLDGFDGVDTTAQNVHLGSGRSLRYDLLIVATGCRIDPAQTEGLCAEGWRQTAFDFYSLEGASALAERLASFEGGSLVVDIAEMPIKCPVAPLEFLFLADAYFEAKGNRRDVDLVLATPLDGAFTKPKASALLGRLLEEKGIRVVPEFSLSTVHGDLREIEAYDGRRVSYDLLVSVPLHVGSSEIRNSGLGDEMGFVPTHKHTLQTLAHSNVFALGDATDLSSSKAGSVAHFQAEVLTKNVLRAISGQPLLEDFDGHSNCFIETGHDRAMLIDFNYETEPLPGRYPLPGLGPFTLLEESHTNHWGKLAFRWAYWNKLLPGDELPIDHRMSMAGKWS
jgi:sulfide:quinone oxidoreductase